MKLEDVVVSKELSIVFMGTPEFSVPVLQALIDNYKVKAIITQPDKVNGRNGQMTFSPVKQLGIDNTILVLQPSNIKEEYQQIIDLNPDLIITCAYGQIIPRELLEFPRLGCINVHASLLPKLRGGAPINRAIMEGHSKTGITIMYMSERMDAGDIISQEEILIDDKDTYTTLHDKLKIMGRDLLIKTLPSIIDGTNDRIPQDESQASYGFIIKKEDQRIDFSKKRRQIINLIRGLSNTPGAYCYFEGKLLKVYEAYITDNYFEGYDGQITGIYKDGFGVKVSNGEVVFKTVQLEGKNRMNAKDFINGQQNKDELIGKILD